jgi:hypothetical protein
MRKWLGMKGLRICEDSPRIASVGLFFGCNMLRFNCLYQMSMCVFLRLSRVPVQPELIELCGGESSAAVGLCRHLSPFVGLRRLGGGGICGFMVSAKSGSEGTARWDSEPYLPGRKLFLRPKGVADVARRARRGRRDERFARVCKVGGVEQCSALRNARLCKGIWKKKLGKHRTSSIERPTSKLGREKGER